MGRRTLVVGIVLVATGTLPGFLVASLAPSIREDFAFGDAAVGLAVGLFYTVCMIGSAPAGRVVDHIGAARSFRIAATLIALGCVGIAVLAVSVATMLPLLVAVGVGSAVGGPAVSALVRAEVRPDRHGLAFGIQQASAPLAALLAGLALPLVAVPLGWRWAFVATAIAVIAAATGASRGGGTPRPSASRTEAASPQQDVAAVRLLAVVAALASGAGVGLTAFVVLYAIQAGVSVGAAGLLLAGVSLVAASRVVLGVLADRGGGDPLRPVPAMLALSSVGFALMAVGTPLTIGVGAIVAGGIGWAWPGALTLAAVQCMPDAPARAVGVLMAGLFAGGAIGPLVFGLLAGAEAFTAVWLGCGGLVLAAAAATVAARRLGRAS